MRRIRQEDLLPRAPHAFLRELARAHRRLFVDNQRRIAEQLGKQSALFAAYERRYLAHSRKAIAPSRAHELEDKAQRARWLFVGDYHTLAESRAYFLALVTALAARERPQIIALEYFATPEQKALDAYVQGTLNEAALRRRAHRTGPLATGDAAWHSYLPLLRWARRHRVPLVALDAPRRGGASLTARDEHAARVLAAVRHKHPRAQICVLAGQLHVTPVHLPRAVLAALFGPSASNARPAPRDTLAALDALVVYQNSEAPFLRQLRGGTLPLGGVLTLGRRVFVAMHTAPIAAQATFLRALEAGREDASALDFGEQLAEVARQAAGMLGYMLPPGLDAWETIPFGRRSRGVHHLGRHPLSAREERALLLRLRAGLPAWLPRAQRLWLPQPWLSEARHLALAGTLLWLHAQAGLAALHERRTMTRLELRLSEALAAAAGVLCHRLLHPQAPGAAGPSPLSAAHGDGLGQQVGDALARGLVTGRIAPAELVALFAPETPTMARFAHWPRLAGLSPQSWRRLLPRGC